MKTKKKKRRKEDRPANGDVATEGGGAGGGGRRHGLTARQAAGADAAGADAVEQSRRSRAEQGRGGRRLAVVGMSRSPFGFPIWVVGVG
ncbi:UNVERIFIED_CONTAM: hypothetical protein Sradi_1761500 [Sesamum radiatum]|uniref:Uncharacterized protein n=1 Tax=Sesamum radiatum TaxID=300843 RepID=A0AAW2TXP2_SESRA